MGLSAQEKVAYAQAINVLFGGAVHANPAQITEDVAIDVDKMIFEITKCSQAIAEFSFSTFYSFTLGHAVKYAAQYAASQMVNGMSLIHALFIEAGGVLLDYEVSGYFGSWVANLMSNRRFVGCVYKARANWRSKIEIGLMGL